MFLDALFRRNFKMNSLRKWLLKPKRSDQSLLAKFYYADEELNAVASELDSFDGRKDTSRCNALVMKLRNHQDSVLTIIEQIMREVIPNSRARRDYRIKFPEEVLQESLAGQLWFGAECLAAGSSIVNKEIESLTMRPLAKSFTKQLDELRSLLREQCFQNLYSCTPQIKEALVNFDRLFADFELSYVSAMVPVKSARDYDLLQDITVLFCETVTRAMKLGLLNQDQFDSYDPVLMFTIPRLAIVCGLLIYPDGPLNPDQDPCRVCEMFRQQLTLLFKIRELLATLHPQELASLEKLICNPSGSQSFTGSAAEVDCFAANRSDAYEGDYEEIGGEGAHRQDSRRGLSLSRPRTPCTLRSISWRGSNEFNFRLPRNTSRDDSCPTDSVPYGLENVKEESIRREAMEVTEDNNDSLCRSLGRDGYHARQVRRILQANGVVSSQNHSLSSAKAVGNDDDDGRQRGRPKQIDRMSCDDCLFLKTNSDLQLPRTSNFQNGHRLMQEECFEGILETLAHHQTNFFDGDASNNKTDSHSNFPRAMNSFENSSQNLGSSVGHSDQVVNDSSLNSNFKSFENLLDDDASNAWRGRVNESDRCRREGHSDPSGRMGNCAQELPCYNSGLHLMHSGSTSTDSLACLDMEQGEISRIIQLAKEAAGLEARSKFKNSSELVHQLFVCISKVADQLQTNFASDFRHILKATFECQSSNGWIADEPSSPTCDLSTHALRIVAASEVEVDLTAVDALEGIISSSHAVCDEPLNPPAWLPDHACTTCMSCKVPFTFVRRRHHCRNCGKIFCSQCSSNCVPLPHIGHSKPVRVCTACYVFHIIPFTNAS